MGKFNSQQYIHNLAGTLMKRIQVSSQTFRPQEARADLAQQVGKRCIAYLFKIVSEFSPETLGKIAACGIGLADDSMLTNTSLWEVTNGDMKWYSGEAGPGADGRRVLTYLALGAIIAAITDIVRAAHAKGVVTSSAVVPHADAYDDVR